MDLGKKETEFGVKEKALVLLSEEQRLKDEAEINLKRYQESLNAKLEVDRQCLKDDTHRLEQGLSSLQINLHSARKSFHRMLDTDDSKGNMVVVPPPESEEPSRDRECIFCSKNEASILFLQCAHQVLCFTCNEDYLKTGGARCQCCHVQVEERIRVYGASSYF